MKRFRFGVLFLIPLLAVTVYAQPPGGFPGGPPGGFRGGPPGGQERKLVKDFDKDGDGRLNNPERKAAREVAAKGGKGGFGPPGGGPGGKGGFGPKGPVTKPGPKVKPGDVKSYPDAKLYDTTTLRTLFFTFENDDWEQELQDFNNTDVDVPATLLVDGKTIPGVGLHFRGMSSYFAVPKGAKRSLNISIDFTDEKARLYGAKTLNLLNAHEDSTFMSTVLYSYIANHYIPTPRANFVKVVVNGESWGIYASVQQFDKEFLQESFNTKKGSRWKVSGSPMGGGGLEYAGDKIDAYKSKFEIKSGDDEKAWLALVNFCKVLNTTAPDKLVQALTPLVDVESMLWFLALDNALINCDGYWIRSSDYSIYLDEKNKFHFIPHDMNEAFRAAGGPGMGGGRGGPGGPPGFGPPMGERPPMGGGVELDPLVGLTDARKPLRSKILVVPEWKKSYLAKVRTIAEKSLDWNNLGPKVKQLRELISDEVQADTRKLSSYDDFVRLTAETPMPGVRSREMPLRTFADDRRKYLLKVTAQ